MATKQFVCVCIHVCACNCVVLYLLQPKGKVQQIQYVQKTKKTGILVRGDNILWINCVEHTLALWSPLSLSLDRVQKQTQCRAREGRRLDNILGCLDFHVV